VSREIFPHSICPNLVCRQRRNEELDFKIQCRQVQKYIHSEFSKVPIDSLLEIGYVTKTKTSVITNDVVKRSYNKAF